MRLISELLAFMSFLGCLSVVVVVVVCFYIYTHVHTQAGKQLQSAMGYRCRTLTHVALAEERSEDSSLYLTSCLLMSLWSAQALPFYICAILCY